MSSILEGELAQVLGDALIAAGIPYDVTLKRTTPGTGDPWDPDSGVVADYPGKGFLDQYTEDERDGTLIAAGDVRVFVVVSTLTVEPVPGDRIEARGKVYSIVNVGADPARAQWELQARA